MRKWIGGLSGLVFLAGSAVWYTAAQRFERFIQQSLKRSELTLPNLKFSGVHISKYRFCVDFEGVSGTTFIKEGLPLSWALKGNTELFFNPLTKTTTMTSTGSGSFSLELGSFKETLVVSLPPGHKNSLTLHHRYYPESSGSLWDLLGSIAGGENHLDATSLQITSSKGLLFSVGPITKTSRLSLSQEDLLTLDSTHALEKVYVSHEEWFRLLKAASQALAIKLPSTTFSFDPDSEALRQKLSATHKSQGTTRLLLDLKKLKALIQRLLAWERKTDVLLALLPRFSLDFANKGQTDGFEGNITFGAHYDPEKKEAALKVTALGKATEEIGDFLRLTLKRAGGDSHPPLELPLQEALAKTAQELQKLGPISLNFEIAGDFRQGPSFEGETSIRAEESGIILKGQFKDRDIRQLDITFLKYPKLIEGTLFLLNVFQREAPPSAGMTQTLSGISNTLTTLKALAPAISEAKPTPEDATFHIEKNGNRVTVNGKDFGTFFEFFFGSLSGAQNRSSSDR